MRLLSVFLITALTGLFGGCTNNGGHSEASNTTLSSTNLSDSENPPPSDPKKPPGRGELIGKTTQTFTATADEIREQLHNTPDGRMVLDTAGDPLCGIDVHYFRYGTEGAIAEPTTASGALMVPKGNSNQCSGTRPILLYAHGTALSRRYNIAELQDTANEAQVEAIYIAATFAAQGYIVVAPNFVGYDNSNASYHPYLNADQQSTEMMDALAAAKLALPLASARTSAGQGLFITGYSQGGYVAMATHRAMQQANVPVTASAPLSGPYALSAQADAVFYGYPNQHSVFQTTLAILGMQKAYGSIYTDPSDFFEMPYAADIESQLPSAELIYDLGVINLPKSALFSSTPLNVSLPESTAPLTGASASALFASAFGNNNLIKNSVREAYLEDAIANPDGGFPKVTDGLPSSTPLNALRVAARKNDLRNWTPTSPVLLCAGQDDPEVYYLNTRLLGDIWSDLPEVLVTVLDVDSLKTPPDPADPYQEIRVTFDATKTAIAEQPNGAAELLDVYHSDLVFSSCLTASRIFFQSVKKP